MSLSKPLKGTKRNELPLAKKSEVVQVAQKNTSLSARKLAERFDCGKCQVCRNLNNKATISEKYESNASSESKRSLKRSRSSQFGDVNDLLYD